MKIIYIFLIIIFPINIYECDGEIDTRYKSFIFHLAGTSNEIRKKYIKNIKNIKYKKTSRYN